MMMTFEEGLPDHFIVFSQTPKAQEHTRRIFVRFCLFLLLPFIGILLVGTSFLSLISVSYTHLTLPTNR